jgi:signal transduction histidine kinase
VLHEFLAANRAELIERCAFKVTRRPMPKPANGEAEHGVPLFLDQLIQTLRMEQMADPMRSREVSGPSGGGPVPSEIGTTAARHGVELLEHGFTVGQVVHDYGDLCQAITDLALERTLAVEIDEFRTLNRCLDNAIAGAVSEFARESDRLAAEKDAQALNDRLGLLARELRDLIQTATRAVTAIKAGDVGLAGATGAVLDRSLVGLRTVVDRSLAGVRVMAGMPARRELISLTELIGEVQIAASLEARARGCRLVVSATGLGLAVDGDREMLSAALGNLLRKAFEFAQPDTEVSLAAYSSEDRVLIEVADHCGGRQAGHARRMLQPFTQDATDDASSGLGLAICRRSVAANHGSLRVRDVPDSGCVFTIDLPRHAF